MQGEFEERARISDEGESKGKPERKLKIRKKFLNSVSMNKSPISR